MALIGQAVSEEKIFEIVDGRTDGRRTDAGRTPDHGHPISSPCEPNGSGELKMTGNNPKQDLVNDDVHNLVRFCQLVLKILRGNKIITSIKGRNSVKILRKMTGNNPKLDLVNNDVHTKFGQILSIRSQDIERNKILMSFKGCNSDKILQKMMGNNLKLDLVDDNVHTKFDQILSICSQDIEWKRNFDINQGP